MEWKWMALLATHHPITTLLPSTPLASLSKQIYTLPILSFSLSLPLSLTHRMAAMHSLALSSPITSCTRKHHSMPGLVSPSGIAYQSSCSSFNGLHLQLPPPIKTYTGGSSHVSTPVIKMVKPTIQFIQGTDEQTIPDVKLTKSRDGTNGVATFSFEQPSVFDSSRELGDITGFYMIDEEGVLQSVDVNAKFVNGKPARLEAKYIMRTPKDWDRFMRFMERYSNANGLQFIKK